MTPVVGHDAAAAAFDAAVVTGRIHHAWLLVGPEGVGKATFALQAGIRLLGGDRDRHAAMIEAHSHPDFKVVEREVWDSASPPRLKPYDQRTDDEKVAQSIRIAQMRWLQPVLAVAPSIGTRRVIVIDSADDLDRNAANALLKNLEEPPLGTTFLLISHAPGRLLPTIRSRCRLLRFGPLDEAQVDRVLRDELPDIDDAERAALVAAGEGSPGRAIRYAGLGVAGLDAALSAIARGDPDNAERLKLGRALALKAAQPRYELFLDRATRFIAAAARERQGEALRQALDAHHAARELAGAALGLSLDPQATVIEMAGIVARLHGGGAGR